MLGNRLACFSFSFFLECAQRGIPAAIENPATSWVWRTKWAEHAAKQTNVKVIDFDFCAFGTQWRKRTRVMYVHVNLDTLSSCKCSGRGCCSFSQLPHKALEGKAPSGAFWTKIAEPYPPRLSSLLAKAYRESRLCSVHRALMRMTA